MDESFYEIISCQKKLNICFLNTVCKKIGSVVPIKIELQQPDIDFSSIIQYVPDCFEKLPFIKRFIDNHTYFCFICTPL